MAASFDELRASTTEQLRGLLTAVWADYLSTGAWPLTQVFHGQHSKSVVQAAFNRRGALIHEHWDQGKIRYELTLLGVLLSERRLEEEQLLVRYLAYLRERYLADHAIERVTDDEVRAALELSDVGMKHLIELIQPGQFSGDLTIGEHWIAGVPRDIDDFPEIDDFSLYVRRRAMECYRSDMPVAAFERERVVLGQTQRSAWLPDDAAVPGWWEAPGSVSNGAETRLSPDTAVATELKEIADRLTTMASETWTAAIEDCLQALQDAASHVGKSWCGAWLGYQSRVYYTDVQVPPPGAWFSQEWGLTPTSFVEDTRGAWVDYPYDAVIGAL